MKPLWLALVIGCSQLSLTTLAADVVPSQLAPSRDETPVIMLHGMNGREAISRADIEALPLYEVAIQHFEGIQGRFAGVWLEDLLTAQGVDEAATLRFIAHDDYTVFIMPEDRQQQDYLLATRLDGEPLTLEDFGPTLLIVPADAEAVEAGTASMTHWVWSIRDLYIQ